mmetsp:Transcript_95979/g.271374  ORF Transcript_95979/g.271374 Transcript_95979/m.271374 type:complete len:203 (+) Transcript_95979:168-776(+)
MRHPPPWLASSGRRPRSPWAASRRALPRPTRPRTSSRAGVTRPARPSPSSRWPTGSTRRATWRRPVAWQRGPRSSSTRSAAPARAARRPRSCWSCWRRSCSRSARRASGAPSRPAPSWATLQASAVPFPEQTTPSCSPRRCTGLTVRMRSCSMRPCSRTSRRPWLPSRGRAWRSPSPVARRRPRAAARAPRGRRASRCARCR